MNVHEPVMLSNGISMPRVGLGMWKSGNGRDAVDAVRFALQSGYRLIDTAAIYGNEEAVGEGVRTSNVKRDDIFVTTKVWNEDQGYDNTLAAIDASLKRLQTKYVDLYLVHWPCKKTEDFFAEENLRAETWKAMEEILASGRARSIGVSNYTIKHLEEMNTYAHTPPVVNQIEFHPFWYRKKLMDYCREHSIAVEAYSPLSRGHKMNDVRITTIANVHGKSNAQVMLRWSMQHGNIVIPKSVHPQRIQENIDVFDFVLSDDDMQTLDALNENYSIIFGTVADGKM